MILVFGSINIDLVARVPSIPRPGETVLAPGYELFFGGKGANQAVAAARATSGSGRVVAMAGRVGNDEFGRAALANLDRNGVTTGAVATGPEPSGCAFITVEESGQNAITVASGANRMVRAGNVHGRFDQEDIVVLQMEVPFSELLALARRARADGARVIWNFAPAPTSFRGSDIRELTAASDVFVANEHEARAAADLIGVPGDEEAAAAALATAGGVRSCSRKAPAAPLQSRRTARRLAPAFRKYGSSTPRGPETPSSAFSRPQWRSAGPSPKRSTLRAERLRSPARRLERNPACRVGVTFRRCASCRAARRGRRRRQPCPTRPSAD